MSTTALATPDALTVQEAIDWAILLHYEQPTGEQRQAFEQWRQASAANLAAWNRIGAVFSAFEAVPADLGRQTLTGLARRRSRRSSLQLLGLVALLPVGWGVYRSVPWQAWSADVATGVGERRTVALPDGSQLVLNSGTTVNIVFGAAERRLALVGGEILVTTAAKKDARPFVVETAHGRIQALGTRFGVRLLSEGATRVAVYQDAVLVQAHASPSRRVLAGEGLDFGAAGVLAARPVSSAEASWERGMLLARNLRLEEVIAELARHRPGVLRCHPEVAHLRISGALSLDDTDASLQTLAGSHGLRIRRWTRYWVEVGPRS